MTSSHIVTAEDIRHLQIFMPNALLPGLSQVPITLHKIFAVTISIYWTALEDAIPLTLLKSMMKVTRSDLDDLSTLTIQVDGKDLQIYSSIEIRDEILWFEFSTDALAYIDPVVMLKERLRQAGYTVHDSND